MLTKEFPDLKRKQKEPPKEVIFQAKPDSTSSWQQCLVILSMWSGVMQNSRVTGHGVLQRGSSKPLKPDNV